MSNTIEDIFDDYGVIGETFSTDPSRTKDYAYLKQQILQWVAEQVIGEDNEKPSKLFDDRQAVFARSKLKRAQLDILKQHGFKETTL